MSITQQRSKALALLALHDGSRMLVLPNVWNPIGARILAAKGYPAVATASAAISSSLGYEDGEKLTRRTMLEIVSRICAAVDVPVTADMESGYAESPNDLQETTRALIAAGAVGMNLEDSRDDGASLRDLSEQSERIATVRETASAQGVHLVINARIDTFVVNQFPEREAQFEETVRRAQAYTDAGADCIYPIGPGDEETLRELRSRIVAPLNVLGSPNAAPLDLMAKIGINRVTFGPFIFRSCLRKFADIADALQRGERYDCFSQETMSRADVAGYLTPGYEGV